MKWIVKVHNQITGSSRHYIYKTEKGARNCIKKWEKTGYIVELYEQIPIHFKQVSLFEEEKHRGSELPF